MSKFPLRHKKWPWGSISMNYTKIQTYRGDSTIGYLNALWDWNVISIYQPSQCSSWKLKIVVEAFCTMCHLFRRKIDIIKELSQPPPGSKELYFSSRYSQPFLIQCMACLWKQRQSYWRNTSYTGVRFTFTLVISLMFGTMLWKLGNKW